MQSLRNFNHYLIDNGLKFRTFYQKSLCFCTQMFKMCVKVAIYE